MARAAEFEEMQKTVKRKKLSLKRKHYVDLTTNIDDTSPQWGKIEDIVKKVHNKLKYVYIICVCSTMFSCRLLRMLQLLRGTPIRFRNLCIALSAKYAKISQVNQC